MEAGRQVGDFRIGEPIRGGVAGARYRGEEIHTGAPVVVLTAPPATCGGPMPMRSSVSTSSAST